MYVKEILVSDVEAEVHDVAVLHNVFFALYAHFAGFFNGGFGAESNVVVIFDDLGADKAFFKVGVDNAGALRGF